MAETAHKLPGRNEPCHCGSGKKYKHCCLAKDEEAERAALEKQASAAPPAAAQEDAPVAPPAPPPRAMNQPWKRGPGVARGTRRITTPRKAG